MMIIAATVAIPTAVVEITYRILMHDPLNCWVF